MYKPTILIDLDGVLNNYTKYDENTIPPIKEGAREFLDELSSLDKYKLVLFTTRNSLLSAKWLAENNLENYFSDITNVKVPAILHIDDRAICFKGNYQETLEEIANFKPHWK